MRLIDADKAKEKLRGNAQKDGNPFVGAIVEMFCEFLDQAPTVESEIRRVPRWIPVTERMPEDADEFVLVIADGIYEGIGFDGALELATFDPEKGWIIEAFPEAKITVTHWMPIPEFDMEVE